MLLGAVVLLYVGGVSLDAEYRREAARGDSDLPAPQAIVPLEASGIGAITETLSTNQVAEPAPFVPILLNSATEGGQANGAIARAVPQPIAAEWSSQISRIVIPAIDVDSKIIPVGWEVKQEGNQTYAVWQVAEYAVGHHLGSANPGDGNNIVLAGHVGGYGKVFKDLIKLKPGDDVTLYSNGQQYLYTIQFVVVVDEEGVSAEQQALNARYIQPTDRETVTLVTCWPATGKNRFSQRIIVRAVPFHSQEHPNISGWSIR
jgi:LPXTG-site transpeptidase (sortase) family protein